MPIDLTNYNPMYVATPTPRGSKYVVTAEHWSELWRLISLQTNNTSEAMLTLLTKLTAELWAANGAAFVKNPELAAGSGTTVASQLAWLKAFASAANTKSDDAVATANAADAKAASAVVTSNTASAAATAAVNTANAAEASATDAVTTADAAADSATQAATDANTAKAVAVQAASDAAGSAAAVAGKVDKVYVDNLAANFVLGAIPDNSITEAKLKFNVATQAELDAVAAIANTANVTANAANVTANAAETPTGAQAKANIVQGNLASHTADYEYKLPTIVGTQIQLTKLSNTNILKFKLDADLSGGAITVSLDEGATDKPLVDVEGEAVTELSKGFVEVVEDAVNFTYAPKGSKLAGTAQPADVLVDKTFMNSDGEQIGTNKPFNIYALGTSQGARTLLVNDEGDMFVGSDISGSSYSVLKIIGNELKSTFLVGGNNYINRCCYGEDKSLYFADFQYIRKINPDGTLGWNAIEGNTRALKYKNGILYAYISSGGSGGRIQKINPSDGADISSINIPSLLAITQIDEGLEVDDEGNMYICLRRSGPLYELVKINSNGTLGWECSISNSGQAVLNPRIVDGVLYCTCNDSVYEISSSGGIVRSFTITRPDFGVVYYNGMVFAIGGSSSEIRRLSDGVKLNNSEFADGKWASFDSRVPNLFTINPLGYFASMFKESTPYTQKAISRKI